MKRIAQIQVKLVDEAEERRVLYKKYKRCINLIDGIDTTMNTFAILGTTSAVALTATIVAAPITVGLGCISAICCGCNYAGKYACKRLRVKLEKHNTIKQLVESTLVAINDVVSKALNDDEISSEEFTRVLNTVSNYQRMKEQLLNKKNS